MATPVLKITFQSMKRLSELFYFTNKS